MLETARMHPGSANDVAVNAHERKDTTWPCALNFFLCTANSERRPKQILLGGLLEDAKNSQTRNMKIPREHAHVKNDASTSTRIRTHANALVIREIVI